ncbi:hypothetical protein ACLOJK_003863 [Asimina triloba]
MKSRSKDLYLKLFNPMQEEELTQERVDDSLAGEEDVDRKIGREATTNEESTRPRRENSARSISLAQQRRERLSKQKY